MYPNPEDFSPKPYGSPSPGPRAAALRLIRFSLAGLIILVTSLLATFLTAPGAAAQETSIPEASYEVRAGFAGWRVVQEALKYEGVPYVLGGPDECIPGWQMDCTCLTTTVFRIFGLELPDWPTALAYHGIPVYGPPRAGDVHIWGDPGDGTGGHVAIDMGNNHIIHANMVTMSTSITPMYPAMYYDPNYLGAWRIVY